VGAVERGMPNRIALGFRCASTCALTIAAALSLLPSTVEAGGDAVYGNRGGDQLREREHRIELSFARGYAELKVRRTVHNGIERHDEAQFWLDIPQGAVATGLRSLGELDGRPAWFEAELLEAEAAAARYLELTGLGGYYPKDPALLSWRSQTQLALQVFPVAPGTDKTVEYELVMPARWEDGRWHVALPSLGTEALPAELILSPDEQLDQLFVDGEVVARGHHVVLDHDIEVALAPRDPARVSLSLASVETGAQHLAHWNITLAPKLSELPKQARIVVVLDQSRSLEPDEIAATRSLAAAYLSHFASSELGAEVALLGFDREVHALTPGFVSAREAASTLASAPIVRRNGSEIGLALAQADALLAEAGKTSPRRIVVVGDLETASRLTPDALAQTVAHSKAIVHFVELGAGEDPSLVRDDQHAWAKLAASSSGVVWQGSAPGVWVDDEQRAWAREVFEELARPVRIDDLRVQVAGLSQTLDYADVLDEGQGIEDLLLSSTAVTSLTIDGLTWNIPVHELAKPSRSEGDRWSALVFGSDVLSELSEPEMMQLAMRGRAVSPVTSYLAIEPGVRPSTEGLEPWESGFGLGGVGLMGGGGGISLAGVGMAGPTFDKQAWLDASLRDGWQRCGGAGIEATLALESQSQELLDVGLTTASPDTSLRACMQQVAWSVELPQQFAALEQWTVTLG
jgi:hypothetical protein